MTAVVHCLRTWRRVKVCGEDRQCGDQLLPDAEETVAKASKMAGFSDRVRHGARVVARSEQSSGGRAKP
ncbi:hypothetical protein MRB53_036538 [Persea americana]|nr:hypothetical protein MRB53_036816 [Persea americana]KAJ8614672.1 hypothetical protein MRB53_036538 [Persea americana]